MWSLFYYTVRNDCPQATSPRLKHDFNNSAKSDKESWIRKAYYIGHKCYLNCSAQAASLSAKKKLESSS